MSRTTTTRRRGISRLTASAALAASVALVGLTGVGSATAASATRTLTPGASTCISEHAAYQVRGDGWATGDGARFKLLRNGQVILASPGRANAWAAELRTAYGNFPGPGTYAVCAYNTGTKNTTVTLSIKTDSQF